MLNNFLNAFSVDDTILIYIFVDLHVDIILQKYIFYFFIYPHTFSCSFQESLM